MRLTLGPVTGRRPDYTIFSVDIGVTNVTKNSRLYAVTSTPCSTLLHELFYSCCVFSTHRHQASTTYVVQHTLSVSVPIHASEKERSVYLVKSFETTRYQVRVHTYAVYTHACGGALGFFKSPVCTFNQAWSFSLSASHYFHLLGKRSGRRMPPAERNAL